MCTCIILCTVDNMHCCLKINFLFLFHNHMIEIVIIISHSLIDSEGWYVGTSFMTGCSGMYPGNYVEKAKDSDCWTLHKYVLNICITL